jgi:hypothetical protein
MNEILEEAEQSITAETGDGSSPLLAVVKGKDSAADEKPWKEIGDVVSISGNGAGFYLARECHVGRLVSLLLPLEPDLRSYDRDKELYRVWGLVQHCGKRTTEDGQDYHVGVSFIGKEPPESYDIDPTQSYRICGTTAEGLWQIEEARKPFTTRKDVRYWESFDVYLTTGGIGTAVTGERSKTENISKHGAAVFTTLDVNIGDRVKLISERFDFSSTAVVCNRTISDDKRQRLHMQFVGGVFPVESLSSK